jgi:uncharacterized protein (DUF1697 family)
MKYRYIALLRGVNLGGKNKLLMKELQAIFIDLGFANVQTYLQSGNVVFDCPKAIKPVRACEKQIEDKIWQLCQLHVPVILKAAEEMKQIQQANPFLGHKNLSEDIYKSLYFTFLSETPDQELLEKVAAKAFLPDEFFIQNRVVYLLCTTGYGKTKLNNTYFETKLRVKATTRNWNTVNQLIALDKAE